MNKVIVKRGSNKKLLNHWWGAIMARLGDWLKVGVRGWVKRGVIAVGATFLLFVVLNWVFPLPDRIEYSTIVTDDKGEVIHAFLTSDQQWRMKTELKEISPLLRKTIIGKEDKYFYYHPGVNPMAMVRAFF